jgi:hypothetical protein
VPHLKRQDQPLCYRQIAMWCHAGSYFEFQAACSINIASSRTAFGGLPSMAREMQKFHPSQAEE